MRHHRTLACRKDVCPRPMRIPQDAYMKKSDDAISTNLRSEEKEANNSR